MNTKATLLLLAATLATTGLAMGKGSTTTFGPEGTKYVAIPGLITVHDAGGMQVGAIPAPRRIDALVFGHGRLFALDGEAGTIVCYYRPGDCWGIESRLRIPIARARQLVVTPDGRLVVSSRTEIVELDRDGRVLRRERIAPGGAAPKPKAKAKL